MRGFFRSEKYKIASELIQKISTKKFRDSELAEQEIKRIVNEIDFRRIKYAYLMEKLDKKITYWSKIFWKLSIFGSIPTLLLFLSIKNVQFEINFLGIKLLYVEKIKEIIFLVGSSLGAAASYIQSGVNKLKLLQKHILIKKYGENQYQALKYIAESDIPETDYDIIFSTGNHFASWNKYTVELIRIVCLFAYFAILFSVIVYIQLVIAVDIWQNSNFSPVIGKTIVSFVVVFAILNIGSYILKAFFKFSYSDPTAASDLELFEESGNLKSEYKDAMTKIATRRRNIRRISVYLVYFIIGVIFLYFIYFR